MIKYKLLCKGCDEIFDSWFANSNEYEKLKKKKILICQNCNSHKIEKTLMAPRLIKSKNDIQEKGNSLKLANIKKKIKDYQKFIKDNFKYVGENFAYEARSIHYNSKKKKKGIYGTASKEEILELKEEGINTQIIPWIKDKEN